jgi:ketosteroid isomerase-like protein
MNAMRAWCLLGLLALAGVMPVQAQDKGDAVSKAILVMENQWLDADKSNNVAVLASLLADKYVATSSSGKLEDKAKTLDDVKTRKYKSTEYEDVQVAVFGSTAIARGGVKSSGTEADGKPFTEHLRWTDTWVKMPGGKWQCVATQYTAI